MKKLTLLGLAIASTSFVYSQNVLAGDFLKDATTSGAFVYWQRNRIQQSAAVVKDAEKYDSDFSHTAMNLALDWHSGWASDMFALNLGALYGIDVNSPRNQWYNEITLAQGKSILDVNEGYYSNRSGLNLYKAALKFKKDTSWANVGWIQPSGNTLITPNWSFYPGTYQGFEFGTGGLRAGSGKLSASYLWANEYKAPWYSDTAKFYKPSAFAAAQQEDTFGIVDDKNPAKDGQIKFIHSAGLNYALDNGLSIDLAYGQAKSYMNQLFLKLNKSFDVYLGKNKQTFNTSYHYYRADDKVSDAKETKDNPYDGAATINALTVSFVQGQANYRLEAAKVKAPGQQGYFLHRMTPQYGSSNGRLDALDYDAGSDFNAHGETSLAGFVSYDLGNLRIPGFKNGLKWKGVGATLGYAYGWTDKMSSYNGASDKLVFTDRDGKEQNKFKEQGVHIALSYTVPYIEGYENRFAGTSFKIRMIDYDNLTDIAPWYPLSNTHQDRKDVKFQMVMPFSF